DNFDPNATEGYIIGPSDSAFGRLIMRRVSDPGGTPTISGNIAITVNATSWPIKVDHLGNTGGSPGRLDALDDRLYAAQIRNGRLWTAHSVSVTSGGVASTSDTNRRSAVRWYELSVPAGFGAPTVVQSGTIFDSTFGVSSSRQYWAVDWNFRPGSCRVWFQHRWFAFPHKRCHQRTTGNRHARQRGQPNDYYQQHHRV